MTGAGFRDAVCLIDTSILCEFLDVPNLAKSAKGIQAEVLKRLDDGATLVLPVATVLETGNHIGQNGDGGQRRRAAEHFRKLVGESLSESGKGFAVAAFPAKDTLLRWLGKFPDYAAVGDVRGKGIGLGDVSILDEWQRQCVLNPTRRILIWSLDRHLACYDRQISG